MHTSHLSLPEVRQVQELPAPVCEPAGVIDILLPGARLLELQATLGYRRSLCWLIRSALGRYRNRLLRKSRITDRHLRTRYQPPGLNLVRVSFRVEADLWVDLRMLSLAMRVSMSQIMVWLIHWEYRRWKLCQIMGKTYVSWDRVGTPTENCLTLLYTESSSALHLLARFGASSPIQNLPSSLIKKIQYQNSPP